MKLASIVYPAEINPALGGSGRLVLALTLPGSVSRLFADGQSSAAAKCSVYRLPVGLFAGFFVLQAQSRQVRVVVPLWDEKSFHGWNNAVLQVVFSACSLVMMPLPADSSTFLWIFRRQSKKVCCRECVRLQTCQQRTCCW